MGTSSGLNSEYTILGKGFILYQEFLIFTGEDIVGNRSLCELSVLFHRREKNRKLTNIIFVSHLLAKCKGQCSLSRTNGSK